MMDKLIDNMTRMHNEKGKQWIAQLPCIVEALTCHWKLNNVIPLNNMTFNYVAKAITHQQQPVVLKIGYNKKTILCEKEALIHFKGNGSIQFLDDYTKYNALLLQQAVPGETLKSFYPLQTEYVMDCYVDTMQKLHSQCLPQAPDHPHISEWLVAINRLIPDHPCPSRLLKKAIHLKNKLLASLATPVFVHGDLHHDNILKHDNSWLAIDPKGIVGEPEFEIAAFDFTYITELASNQNAKTLFESRVALLAKKANLDAQRIQDWVFVRLILMAAWLIEDNSDPGWAIQLAEMLI